MIDRALDYAALERLGLTAAQIARRRRRSKGHVSILLRLGRALLSAPSEELLLLRSPLVTWKLVQRLVRTRTDDRTLLKQLRNSVGGFSSLTLDRRRGGRRAAKDGTGAAPGSAWVCDTAWARRDPEGYVQAYRRHLARQHAEVGLHLRASLAYPGLEPARVSLVGQSIRRLTASLDRSAGAPRSDAGMEPSAGSVGRAPERAIDPVAPSSTNEGGTPTPAPGPLGLPARRALAALAELDVALRAPSRDRPKPEVE